MKMTKRIFSLALCLVLMMALALPAFAADDHDHKLTIKGYASGHEYNVYRLFKGDMVKKDDKMVLSNIQWGEAVKGDDYDLSADILEALREAEGLDSNAAVDGNDFAAATTANDVAEILKGYVDQGVRAQAFANVVGEILKEGNHIYATATETDATNHIYTANVSDGYYLIMDKNTVTGYDFATKYLLSVPENTELKVKGDVPQVGKTVSDAKAAENASYHEEVALMMGKPYFYKWDGTLHENIADYSFYKYSFVDTLPPGVVLAEADLTPVTADNIHDAIVSVRVISESTGASVVVDMPAYDADSNPNGYKVSYVGNTFTLGWDDLIKAYKEATGNENAALNPTDNVVVEYRAALISAESLSVEGLTNKVKVNFSNNPYNFNDFGETPEDPAIVFTFGLNLFKKDAADNKKHLDGAKFDLYVKLTGDSGEEIREYAVLALEEETETKKIYTITGWTDEPEAGRVQIVTKATEEGVGKDILIKGLDATLYDSNKSDALISHAATYYLHETEAPAGYNLPYADTYFHISAYVKTVDGKLVVNDIDYSVNGNLVAEDKDGDDVIVETAITVDVLNGAGATLPSTGGTGTTMLYIVGGILVAVAIVLLVSKRRVEG